MFFYISLSAIYFKRWRNRLHAYQNFWFEFSTLCNRLHEMDKLIAWLSNIFFEVSTVCNRLHEVVKSIAWLFNILFRRFYIMKSISWFGQIGFNLEIFEKCGCYKTPLQSNFSFKMSFSSWLLFMKRWLLFIGVALMYIFLNVQSSKIHNQPTITTRTIISILLPRILFTHF